MKQAQILSKWRFLLRVSPAVFAFLRVRHVERKSQRFTPFFFSPTYSCLYYMIVPFPGYDWLTRIASPDTKFTWNGTTYSSAFDAMLYGNPAAYACRNFNCWLNNILFSPQVAAWFIQKTGSIELGHYLLCYVRNLIGGCLVYYGTAAAFAYFCYMYPPLEDTWDDRKRPTRAIMWDQIRLAQSSLFIYTMLPVVDEYLVENGIHQSVLHCTRDWRHGHVYFIPLVLLFPGGNWNLLDASHSAYQQVSLQACTHAASQVQ